MHRVSSKIGDATGYNVGEFVTGDATGAEVLFVGALVGWRTRRRKRKQDTY